MSRFTPIILSILTTLVMSEVLHGAHNIYSYPDLSKTSDKFDGYLLDFKGVQTPNETYWSFCNFLLDITDFKKTHKDAIPIGAYGGFQTKKEWGKAAILSFWQMTYTENGEQKTHRASRVWPDGDESSFNSSEGKGNLWLKPFNWETNKWYRFFLKSWEDLKTGNTFIGQWFMDSKGKWTLFAYFNSGLKNSFITGDMHFFQENFNVNYNGVEREFQIKNVYAHDLLQKKWISLPSSQMNWSKGFELTGNHEFGATTEYFWGKSGLPVKNQEEYDKSTPYSLKYTITQPESPEDNFKGIFFSYFNVKATKEKAIISWEISEYDSPQLSYRITIKDSIGNVIHEYESTRPEEREYIAKGPFSGKTFFEIEVTSVFGEKSTESVNYSI